MILVLALYPFHLLAVMESTMENDTQPPAVKTETPKSDDAPALGLVISVIGGFILVTTIFAIFLFTHV